MKDRARLLYKLDLGASVAENDENLASYFVPTLALEAFVDDRYDLVRGAKGSGKSAILRQVSEQQSKYVPLSDVVLQVATEHTGEPAFKRAFDHLDRAALNEQELINAWKTYLLNLALDALEGLGQTQDAKVAIEMAERVGLRYRTSSPFKKVWWSLLRMLHPKSFTVGVDTVAVEFPDAPPAYLVAAQGQADFPEVFDAVCRGFRSQGQRCWLLLDRLDAAFKDPDIELVALRALLHAYKDFMGQANLRVKLFFRTDLFELVTMGTGFRELTHVTDRASPPIAWDTDQLLQMIMRRFGFNKEICSALGIEETDLEDPSLREVAFYELFPQQVDVGPRKTTTWSWMCSRIRDGNGVQTPRDLHGLVKFASSSQSELIAVVGDDPGEPLITAVALKKGLSKLSSEKLETTLLAENPDLAVAIRAFKKNKAEQNGETLEALLGPDWERKAEGLVRIGFLEKTGASWKVPMLYRDALEITQGAAFEKAQAGRA